MSRRRQLSRADLLEALARTDAQGSQLVATQLGLSSSLEQLDVDSELTEVEIVTDVFFEQSFGIDSDVNNTKSTVLSHKPFWLCVEREQLNSIELPALDKKLTDKAQVWPKRPIKSPSWFPLASLREVLPRLLSELGSVAVSHALDIVPIVKAISRGQHLGHLPRKQRRTLGENIHIIHDRQIHLTTFWRDQQLVQAALTHLLANYACSMAVLQDGAIVPRSWMDSQLRGWQLPAVGSTVLILSDLGTLSAQPQLLVTVWRGIIEQLHRRQCKVVALVPCDPSDCDPYFKAVVTIIPWQPIRYFASLQYEQQALQCEKLLILLAPALRLEPGLIRQVRRGYSRLCPNEPMPASVESMLWQHAAIAERHSTAASWHTKIRLTYLEKFAGLSHEEKAFSLAIIKQWRGRLSEQVWFEEIIELDEASQFLVADDVVAAISYFQQIDEDYQYERENLSVADQVWLRRVLQRLPQHVFHTAEVGACFQRFKYDFYGGEQLNDIDPRNLPLSSLAVTKVELCQHGQTLCLLPFSPQLPRPTGFSPLGLFSLRHPLVRIEQKGKRLAEMRLGEDMAIAMPSGTEFELVTDCERLVFNTWYYPEMAESADYDSFGLYVDIALGSPHTMSQKGRDVITQRFRYIPPQNFLMGSSKKELGRFDNEVQHEVTLTQGYWLSDTTITQAFWKAISGENPSQFQGEQLPVEQISWDDVQAFIAQLKQQCPLLDVRLPTEAEWECACRAGTTTSFSLGGKYDLNSERVNYSGKWDNYDFKGKTKNIKSLPANPWGLYEMHGNVFEWCQDEWQEKLPAVPVTDPIAAPKAGQGQRVIRGGSWRLGGRLCRSAHRDSGGTDYRSLNLGVRLALGHVNSGQEQADSSTD